MRAAGKVFFFCVPAHDLPRFGRHGMIFFAMCVTMYISKGEQSYKEAYDRRRNLVVS